MFTISNCGKKIDKNKWDFIWRSTCVFVSKWRVSIWIYGYIWAIKISNLSCRKGWNPSCKPNSLLLYVQQFRISVNRENHKNQSCLVIFYNLLWRSGQMTKSKSESYECKLVPRDFRRAVSWTKKTRNKEVNNADSTFFKVTNQELERMSKIAQSEMKRQSHKRDNFTNRTDDAIRYTHTHTHFHPIT